MVNYKASSIKGILLGDGCSDAGEFDVLPNEMLCEIMLCFTSIGLLGVSQVCQRFRDCAMADITLIRRYDNLNIKGLFRAVDGEILMDKVIQWHDIGIHFGDGESLRYASENGHVGVVQLLLDRGVNVHAYDDLALYIASEAGHLAVVQLLLDHCADGHTYDETAFHAASANGHTAVVQLLLNYGANVHADNDYALRLASRGGHFVVVQLLLSLM